MRQRSLRALVLTSHTPANVYLVNELRTRFDVVGVIIESPPPADSKAEKYARRRRLVERHGWFRALNKLGYNWIKSRTFGKRAGREIQDHFFPNDKPVRYTHSAPTITVPSINDRSCIDFINKLAPDVLTVCGTTVIKPDVFTLAPKGAINIHTGITPEYRSAEPIFWALYKGDPENVGVTIHYIDKGIDTGAIIHQANVPIFSDDTLNSIYCRCIRTGAALYLRTLEEIADGTAKTIDKSHVKGRAFYSIDLGIFQYLVFWYRFWRLKRRLPRSPEYMMADGRQNEIAR